jgi:hypothetical protein
MRQGRAQTLGWVALGFGVTAGVGLLVARARKKPRQVFDYSHRSGFRRPAHEMRGAAAPLAKQLLDDRPRALERDALHVER